MNFDLRLPLGFLFSVFGVLLVGEGVLGDPAARARSLGLNVNLGWGAVVLLFGISMLFLAIRARRRPPDPPGRQ
jgi:hypothetical protein